MVGIMVGIMVEIIFPVKDLFTFLMTYLHFLLYLVKDLFKAEHRYSFTTEHGFELCIDRTYALNHQLYDPSPDLPSYRAAVAKG